MSVLCQIYFHPGPCSWHWPHSCSEWPLNLQNCNNGALFGDGSKILQLHFSEDLARSDDILSWWSLPQLSATTVIAVSESFFQLGSRSQVVMFVFTFKLCSNNCCCFRGGTSWSNLIVLGDNMSYKAAVHSCVPWFMFVFVCSVTLRDCWFDLWDFCVASSCPGWPAWVVAAASGRCCCCSRPQAFLFSPLPWPQLGTSS